MQQEQERAAQSVKFEGVTIKIGERDYVVPPLNFRQLRQFKDVLARFTKITESADPYEELSQAVPVIHAAISRNYPDIKVEDIEEALDLANYRAVIQAVIGVSGISEEELAKRGVPSLPKKPVAA